MFLLKGAPMNIFWIVSFSFEGYIICPSKENRLSQEEGYNVSMWKNLMMFFLKAWVLGPFKIRSINVSPVKRQATILCTRCQPPDHPISMTQHLIYISYLYIFIPAWQVCRILYMYNVINPTAPRMAKNLWSYLTFCGQ